MSCWALVPVKTRAEGKRRLSAVLDEAARMSLVRAMLGHVLSALRRSPVVDAIAVTTPERDTLPADILLLPDPGRGVNDALQAGLVELAARGATRVAVVAADLPLITPEDVAGLLAASAATGIALAADRHGTGTNAVALVMPSSFRPQFGTGSLARHVAESMRCGITPGVVRLPGLEFDVDDPEDLVLLRERAARDVPAP